MEPTEQKPSVKTVKKEIKAYHPIRSLFLIDIVRDPDSRPVLVWALLNLLFGTLIYHWLEGWNYLDALYFCVISLATVGYGDFAPTTQIGRAFTIVYVINGIVMLLALFDRIRIVRSRRLEISTD